MVCSSVRKRFLEEISTRSATHGCATGLAAAQAAHAAIKNVVFMVSDEQLRVLGVGKEDESTENALYKAFSEGGSRLLKVERKKEGQEVGEMEDRR